MKLSYYIFAAFITFTLYSCKKNPMKPFEDGSWNNERSIVNIKFEHQVGNAEIKRDKAYNGLVSFLFNENGSDKSKIVIKELELSYGAKADLSIGDALNFDNPDNTASIVVTAASGEKRTWKINCLPFKDELIGTWKISALSVYGGAWPEFGGVDAFADIRERSWNWKTDQTGPEAEYDNTLTFTLEGIDEQGNTFGKLVNDAGTDGKYANFIFIADPDGARTPIDVNYQYRKIPTGESSWKRNSAQGTITFTNANKVVTTGRFVTSGTETLEGGKSMTVKDRAFTFELKPTFVWIDIYQDREKLVENAKKFWVQVSKTTN
jgi:hypothetical protein